MTANSQTSAIARLDFEQLPIARDELEAFTTFLKRNRCEEVLGFICDVNKYRQASGNKHKRRRRIKKIIAKYFDAASEFALNISQSTKEAILRQSSQSDSLDSFVFDSACDEMQFLLENDILPRYEAAKNHCGSSLESHTSDSQPSKLFRSLNQRLAAKLRKSTSSRNQLNATNMNDLRSLRISLPKISRIVVIEAENIEPNLTLEKLILSQLEKCDLPPSINKSEFMLRDAQTNDEIAPNERSSVLAIAFLGRHLRVNFASVFKLALHGQNNVLGMHVDAFASIRVTLIRMLDRLGFAFHNFNFYLEAEKVDTNAPVHTLACRTLRMALRRPPAHSFVSRSALFFSKANNNNN